MSVDSQAIAALNDALRRTFQGGRIAITIGVRALPERLVVAALFELRTFSPFTKENDPYGEHDFGSFEVEGSRFFFKIDYYDASMTIGSSDPSDPSQTTRVLTLMLAEEY
jgi:hypothetical protein